MGRPDGSAIRQVVVCSGAAALGLLAVAGCAQIEGVLGGPGEEADAELTGVVLLEPAGSDGPDPFTASAAAPADDGVATLVAEGPRRPADSDGAEALGDPADAVEQHDDGQTVIRGDVAGLYAGSPHARSCDAERIAATLAEDPERAEAWGSVVGIAGDEVAAYLATLTPLRLTSDTRVVNHGFADGVARPHEAVLQRGTAVLVDERGVPRVRCACGNPLAIAGAPSTERHYAGQSWPGFSPGTPVVVEPAAEAITAFEIVNTDPDASDDELVLTQEAGADGAVTVAQPSIGEVGGVSEADADDLGACEAFTADGQSYQVVVEESTLGAQACEVYSDFVAAALDWIPFGWEPEEDCEPPLEALPGGETIRCEPGTGVYTVGPADAVADDDGEDLGPGPEAQPPGQEADEAPPRTTDVPEGDACRPFTVRGGHYQVIVTWHASNTDLGRICELATESAIDDVMTYFGEGERGEVSCQPHHINELVEEGEPRTCGTSYFSSTVVSLGGGPPGELGDDEGIVFCDPFPAAGGHYQIGLPERYLELGFSDCADFDVILAPDLGDYLVMGVEPDFLEGCQPSFDALGGGQEIVCSFGPDYLVLRPAGGGG